MIVYLALGSNLGDRALYLAKAVEDLEHRGLSVLRRASIYETEPKDVSGQPWFLNTIIEVRTQLEPRSLLDLCLDVERLLHRVRLEPRAARTLDIDIVIYGDRLVNEPDLSIPHPRFADRRFVLAPLAELAPNLIDPRSGKSVSVLLTECPDPMEVRLFNPPPSQ